MHPCIIIHVCGHIEFNSNKSLYCQILFDPSGRGIVLASLPQMVVR